MPVGDVVQVDVGFDLDHAAFGELALARLSLLQLLRRRGRSRDGRRPVAPSR